MKFANLSNKSDDHTDDLRLLFTTRYYIMPCNLIFLFKPTQLLV